MIKVELEFNKFSRNTIEVFIKSKILTIKFWGTKENKELYVFCKKTQHIFLEPFVNMYYNKNPKTVVIRKSFLFSFLENKNTYFKLKNSDIKSLLDSLEELNFEDFKRYLHNF